MKNLFVYPVTLMILSAKIDFALETDDIIVNLKVTNSISESNKKVIKGEIIDTKNMGVIIPMGLEKFSISYLSFQNDQTLLSRESMRDFSRIYVLSGLVKGTKVIIPDINRDGNFTNDSTYKYSVIKIHRRAAVEFVKTIDVPYTYKSGNTLFKRSIQLKILPYEPVRYSAVSTSELLETYFSINMVKSAILKLNKRNYIIHFIKPADVDAGYVASSFLIKDAITDAEIRYEPSIKVGEEFFLNGKAVTIRAVSFFCDSVQIQIRDSKYVNGLRMNNILPDEVRHLLLSKLKKEQWMDNRLILVDFWGSWCAPCIRSIPDLKNIYDLYVKGGLMNMLSVAHERTNDTTKMQKIIREYDMDWSHLIEFYEQSNYESSLINKFRISEYPTTILLDNKWRILYRGVGDSEIKILGERINAALSDK
ncbi:TlpA family protein disulfide reductase [Dyadobacter psychrotolerans]|uniref:TlpA family protein disulfide reductase n=1 Tax=Dyadobacter psychrotolerans TaxID=2541721 RepID=A0A4R5DBQ3_9BACT|nr:TlpA disulfide reductase family protein [Dyadobacter psychrotolerans]TDE07965.1 TlpA family protein disulfide reductase [Dyadobacter psychrotolerans]